MSLLLHESLTDKTQSRTQIQFRLLHESLTDKTQSRTQIQFRLWKPIISPPNSVQVINHKVLHNKFQRYSSDCNREKLLFGCTVIIYTIPTQTYQHKHTNTNIALSKCGTDENADPSLNLKFEPTRAASLVSLIMVNIYYSAGYNFRWLRWPLLAILNTITGSSFVFSQ